jgi:hypothetical protein
MVALGRNRLLFGDGTAPAVLQKIGEIESVVDLRPPDVKSVRSYEEVLGLLWSGIL